MSGAVDAGRAKNARNECQMDLNKKILLRPNFLLERVEGEIIVYHPSSTTSVYLNETGALVWELCNGQTCTADIVRLLVEVYPESRFEIEKDVPEIIQTLVEHGVASLV